jgi:hypothetical protein
MPGRQRWRALLGIFAILLQALLFALHEHPLPFSVGEQPLLRSQADAAPLSSTLADADCQVCAALHHLSASPGEFAQLAAPPRLGPQKDPAEASRVASSPGLAFRARAPPQA